MDRKSQTVLQSARKDFDSVVAQAQKEFTKLTTETPSTSSEAPIEEKTESDTATVTATEPTADAEPIPSTSATPTQESSSTPAVTFQSVFSRLQSRIPPNVIATVQSNLPESLRTGDLGQIRSTLSAEFQRVQGVTRAQAEEYMHKSEAIIRDVVKEAGDVLRDAVKVVPPEEADPTPVILWDGTDIWQLAAPFRSSGVGKGKGKAKDGRRASESQRAVATRAEALLKQLRQDPAILSVDPEATDSAREVFEQWLKTEEDALEGGVGGAQWTKKVEGVLDDGPDGTALRATQDALG